MAAKTVRGGVIVEFNSSSFVFIPFIFNPAELEEEDSPNYVIQEIPGSPDPWVQYVSGKGLYLNCTVIVEQFRIDEMLTYVNNNLYQADVRAGLRGSHFSGIKLTNEELAQLGSYFPDSAGLYIEQLRKLIFPEKSALAGYSKSPPRITFIFGDSSFVGRVLEFRVRKTWFNNELQVESATIELRLIRDNPKFPRYFAQLPMSANAIVYPFNKEGENQKPTGDYINR